MAEPLPSYVNILRTINVRVQNRRVTWTWPVILLFSRLILFAAFQALAALLLGGSWDASIAWWPVVAIATNLAGLVLLLWLFRKEGGHYFDLWTIDRSHLGRDLLAVLVIMVILAPVGYLPNVWLANLLFGGPDVPASLMFRALPAWVAWLAFFGFPLTIGLAELPTYFGYVMPRLEVLTRKPGLAYLLPAFMLALQHIALPLIFDLRFILWRALMFLPFALVVGLVLRWRPRLFPFMMILHMLIDFSAAYYFLAASIK